MPFEPEHVVVIGVGADDQQDPGVDILMTIVAEQETIRCGRPAAVTAVVEMVQMAGTPMTGPAPAAIAAPHREAHCFLLLCARKARATKALSGARKLARAWATPPGRKY
jgi:hypothetical protein